MKNPRPEEMLSKVIERLEAKGYSDDLRACPEGLRAVRTGKTYAPEALVIDEVARFEGISDPDDEAVVFALGSPNEGPIGTYVVPFGPTMQPPDADIVHRLRHAAPRA